MKKLPVGISSCLLGEKVRYDGGHKRHAAIVERFSEFFAFQPFCPEVAIGLGVPRPPIHLLETDLGLRSVGVKDASQDVTERLLTYADRQKSRHAGLCGYILKKDSPSCGMVGVKVVGAQGLRHDGVGIYAEAVLRHQPMLPVEEEGRLAVPELRDSFLRRVYVLHRWRRMLSRGLTAQAFSRFHARHDLLVVGRTGHSDLRRLLADTRQVELPAAEQYLGKLLELLTIVPSRDDEAGVLRYLHGRLRQSLSAGVNTELSRAIAAYRHGEAPRLAPVSLLRRCVRQVAAAELGDSYFWWPYPRQLAAVEAW